MRHMETFKGEAVSKYVPGIEKECGPQEVQINRLRRKYLNKILLSSNNLFRYTVIAEVVNFSETHPDLMGPNLVEPNVMQKTLTKSMIKSVKTTN